MQILVPLIAALVPVIITPGLLFHFDITPKVALLLYGVAAAFLVSPWRFHDISAPLRDARTRTFVLILAAQLAWICVATALSGYRALSLDGSEWRRLGLTTWIAIYAFCFIALVWMRTPADVARLLRWAVAAGAVVSVYTIAQYAGFDPLLPAGAYLSGEGPFTIVRPPATLGHADYAAAYLLFVCFAAAAQARVEEISWKRNAARLTVAMSAFAVVLTGTRGALVALVAGALFLICAEPMRIRRRALGLAAAGILLVAFAVSPAGEKLRARVHWSKDDIYGGARLLLWRDTLRMAQTAPVLGVGPEVFVLRFPQFQSIELSRAYPDFFHESPHNIVLDALAGEGAPGAVLLLASWAVSLYCGWKALRSRPSMAGPLLAGGIALFIAHQFTVFVPATALIALLVQTMLVAMQAPAATAEMSSRSFAMRLSLAPLAALFLIVATRVVVADYEINTAIRRMSAGDVPGARAAYRIAERWRLAGGASDLAYSRSMAALAAATTDSSIRTEAFSEAMRTAVNAAANSEQRQNAWYSLAMLFAAQGDAPSMERSLRNAIAWAPNWFKPHWSLAQFLEMQKRHGEAIVEAASALDRNAGKNVEVVRTWNRLSQRALP